MTIDRFSRLEATKDLKLLKRWYNVFPLRLFNKRINNFYTELSEILNAKEINKELLRLITYNRILQLSNLYTGAFNILISKNKNDNLKKEIGKQITNDNLIYIVTEIKRLTDIDIKGLEDLKRLQKEIERRTDKYLESYNKKTENKQEISFMQIVIGIFAIMEMNYTPEMTLFAFKELKELAIKKTRQLENARDKRNNK